MIERYKTIYRTGLGWIAAAALLLGFVGQAYGQGPPAAPSIALATHSTTIANNLTVPWDVALLPDSSILVAERGGTLSRANTNGTITRIATTNAYAEGEGGLLGIALHPSFAQNNYLYLYSTQREGQGTVNKVERYTLSGSTLTNKTLIIDGIPGARYHDGGRIAFGPDGYLYITTGDASNPNLAQSKSSLAGKILRLTDTGANAPGNPFNTAVYSYGHRNPQGLAWDSTGALWSTEHGQTGLDEINRIEKGGNYGWPTIQGSETQAGLISPVLHSGSETWAPASAAFVGDFLFFGGLRGETLYAYNTKTRAFHKLFNKKFGRIRTVRYDPQQYSLYLTTSNRDGRGTPQSGDDRVLKIPVPFPNNNVIPTFTVTVSETGGAVTLYSDRYCSRAISSATSVTDRSPPYTVDVTTNILSRGSHTVYAKHTGSGGASSGCSAIPAFYILDTTISGAGGGRRSPGIPTTPGTPALAIRSNSGSTGDTITNDNTPNIIVTSLTAGETLTVTAAKSGSSQVTKTAAITGTSQTVTLGTLADGVWRITAKAVNASGISSAASPALTVTIDTAPPIISVSTTGTGASARHTPSADEPATARYRNNVTSASCVPNTNTSGWTVYTSGALTAHNPNGLCIIYTDTAGNKAGRHIAGAAEDRAPVAPAPPSSVTLSSPSSSPGSDTTPTFTVTVSETGGAVTLYSDRSCTTALSAAVAVTDTRSPYTVSVTTYTLTTRGRYTVYAKHTKDALASGCSSASASYTLDTTTSTTTYTTTTTTPPTYSTTIITPALRRTIDTGGILIRGDGAPGGPSKTISCSTQITRDLTIGSRGEDVRALQMFLNSTGYLLAASGPGSPGSETTYFGQVTRQALIAYQWDNAISPADGYFNKRTRDSVHERCKTVFDTPPVTTFSSPDTSALQPSACTGNPIIIGLIPVYTRGTTNDIIRLFQRALNGKGHLVSQTGFGSPGRETTVFGPATERAVRAFQAALNLPVTGTLDHATQCALIPDITTNRLTYANIIAALQQKVAEIIAARRG